MKKIIVILLVAIMVLSTLTLTGCGNKDLFDTVYTFDYCIIQLPNGSVIEGKVVTWTDYSDGDQLQVQLEDGNTYLVHSLNCTLIAYPQPDKNK